MLPVDFDTLIALLLLMGGVGVFVRIVAAEKHRRERWLQYQMQEKLKSLKRTTPADGQDEWNATESVEVVAPPPACVTATCQGPTGRSRDPS